MDYFEAFPKVSHVPARGMPAVVLRDITRLAAISAELREDPHAFLPYTVRDGMKAEDVARHYYGSPRDAWLVWLSNRVVDPWFEWVMDEDALRRHVAAEYAALSGETGNAVVRWAMREDIEENIARWRMKDDHSIEASPFCFSALRAQGTGGKAVLDKDFDASLWEPVRHWADEVEKNESRRHVFLLHAGLRDQAERELGELIRG